MTPTENQNGKLKWSAMSEREKDALVHERLFGECAHNWILRPGKRNSYACTKCDIRPRCGGMADVWPGYTTSHAACARVKEGFWRWDARRDQFGYWVSIGINGEYSVATATTECEAFALAALRASGVEIED